MTEGHTTLYVINICFHNQIAAAWQTSGHTAVTRFNFWIDYIASGLSFPKFLKYTTRIGKKKQQTNKVSKHKKGQIERHVYVHVPGAFLTNF